MGRMALRAASSARASLEASREDPFRNIEVWFVARCGPLRSTPGTTVGAKSISRGQVVPAIFAARGRHAFHRNHANDFFDRGHAGLQFFPGVILHSAHAGGASRDSHKIRLVGAAGTVSYTHLTLPTKRIV